MSTKILMIAPFFPYPLISGGHQAYFNSIDVLRKYFNIHLLFNDYKQNKTDIETLKELWPEVIFHPYFLKKRFKNKKDFIIKLINKLFSFFWKNNIIDTEFSSCIVDYSPDYLDYINYVILNNQIDIVQIEFIHCLSLVTVLPKSIKKVFVHHELRFSRHELFIKEHNFTNSFYYKYKYNCLKNEELSLLSLYNAIITLSDIDAQKLTNEGISKQKLYPSFAIVKQTQIKNNNIIFNGNLTFIGPEYHNPNKVGMEWFLNNSWPIILKNDNKLKLKIIGIWSIKTKRQWRSKYRNIEFLGFIKNLHEAMEGSIMIVPITIGSGIRMKILEATTMKIPFVSTKIGVEGLPFKNKEDCFITNDVIEFANYVIILKNDLTLQHKFIISSNNKINLLFSPDKLKESRSLLYHNILNY